MIFPNIPEQSSSEKGGLRKAGGKLRKTTKVHGCAKMLWEAGGGGGEARIEMRQIIQVVRMASKYH